MRKWCKMILPIPKALPQFNPKTLLSEQITLPIQSQTHSLPLTLVKPDWQFNPGSAPAVAANPSPSNPSANSTE